MSTRTPAKTEASQEGISLARELRDVLTSGIILADARGKATFMSQEVGQILGLAASSAPGAAVGDLPSRLQNLISECLASGKPVSNLEIDLKGEGRKAGSIRVSIVELRVGAAEQAAVVVISDLTSTTHLEQNFQHLDRLASIGTLSASMAHEIRNALQAGKTFFDLLFEKHQDAELVDVARREICRIDAITSRMLKFVGTAEPAFGEVHLHEVLEHSLRLVQPQMDDRLISLNRSFQAVPDRVSGDDLQLQQAFVNLFLNALEAMGPRGTLTVATQNSSPGAGPKGLPADTRIALTIQDSGAGIPAENLARLFEPFFTTKPGGTGLGLPITKRIIQEHRGDISVESEPGKGTTFRITLPALVTVS
jgi:signal transduction histidine kinase